MYRDIKSGGGCERNTSWDRGPAPWPETFGWSSSVYSGRPRKMESLVVLGGSNGVLSKLQRNGEGSWRCEIRDRTGTERERERERKESEDPPLSQVLPERRRPALSEIKRRVRFAKCTLKVSSVGNESFF